MAMSANQGYLTLLTSRKHDLGLKLTKLTNEETILAREMKNVSSAYNKALQAQTLMFSNNAGVSYTVLNYSTLMKPSVANQNKPYLITNGNGKVMLDSKYAKYAKLISPDGKAGGDYESNRVYILSQVTGIPESRFDEHNSALDNTDSKVDVLEKAKDKTTRARNKAYETITDNKFVEKWGKTSHIDFGSSSNSSGFVELDPFPEGSQNKIGTIVSDIINNISPYLDDKALEAFKIAANAVGEDYKLTVSSVAEGSKNNDKVRTSNGNFSINIDDFKSQIMGAFVLECEKNGSGCATKESEKSYHFEVIAGKGKDDENYKAYLEAKAEEDAAKAKYGDAVNEENQVFTAAEETQIQFYDLLFGAIAERGWEYDEQITDTDYLNNTLQNNCYTITTVEENKYYDENEKFDSSKKNPFIFNTDIASNFDKIFFVNDEDKRQEALAKYEFEKSIITAKEKRNDIAKQNAQTELNAVNTRIQSLESMIGDAIESKFNIFS